MPAMRSRSMWAAIQRPALVSGVERSEATPKSWATPRSIASSHDGRPASTAATATIAPATATQTKNPLRLSTAELRTERATAAPPCALTASTTAFSSCTSITRAATNANSEPRPSQRAVRQRCTDTSSAAATRTAVRTITRIARSLNSSSTCLASCTWLPRSRVMAPRSAGSSRPRASCSRILTSPGAVAGSIPGSVTSRPSSCGILSSSRCRATATRGRRSSRTSFVPAVT